MREIKYTNNNVLWTITTVLSALLMMTGPAAAEPVIEWLGNNYPSDMNADGTAVAGNTGDGYYDAFRWTKETGVVNLGMSTGRVLGGGAGTPDISDDGLHVSASIITPDSLFQTQGIWTKGAGWAHSFPPVPADGGSLDDSYGSCWGLSGDGRTLTGFYWRTGQTDGTAHANTWSADSGFTALANPYRNYRGNDLSYDGSVVVGWSERFDGVWCPTVWEDGGFTVLHNEGIFTEAEGVSGDGNTIWGSAQDTLTNQKSAAIWLRTESGWDEQILGVLPGTFPGSGAAIAQDMSADGNTIVGYNTFDGSPFNNTGFVWTLAEGMVSAADFFAAQGVTLPPFFNVATLTGISANGNVITGFGSDTRIFPSVTEGFVITLNDVAAVPGAVAFRGLTIEPNFPNPFNPSTIIALAVETPQPVRMEIFNARGQLVRQLHDGPLAVGRHEMLWDGRDHGGLNVASGVYFARARGANGESQSQRMMLVK